MVFAGDHITARFRSADREAVGRGEKIFVDVFQQAHDFAVVFDIRRDAAALRFLLESQAFCQLDERFAGIQCESVPSSGRTYFAHDGMFGVLDRPDKWEVAELPDGWPIEFVNAGGEDGARADVDGTLDVRDGAAASGTCLVEARLTFADGHYEDWRPARLAVVSGVLERWTELGAFSRADHRRIEAGPEGLGER